jgi:hypothetical protein
MLHFHNLVALRLLITCRLNGWKPVTWFGPCVRLVREWRGFIRFFLILCCLSSLNLRVSVRSWLTIILRLLLRAFDMLRRLQIVLFDIIIVSVLLDRMTYLFLHSGPWPIKGIDLRSIFVGFLRLVCNFLWHCVMVVSVIIAIFFSLLCAWKFLLQIVDLLLWFMMLQFELVWLNFIL